MERREEGRGGRGIICFFPSSFGHCPRIPFEMGKGGGEEAGGRGGGHP